MRPDLILLDLGLPRESGLEVLAEITSDPALSAIPVVVLTSSPGEEDMLRALELRVEAAVLKPVGAESFMRIAHEIESFFVALVKLTVDAPPS
jgi:CheY-like chemotaxis protein